MKKRRHAAEYRVSKSAKTTVTFDVDTVIQQLGLPDLKEGEEFAVYFEPDISTIAFVYTWEEK